MNHGLKCVAKNIRLITIWAEGYICHGEIFSPFIVARVNATCFSDAVRAITFLQSGLPITYYDEKILASSPHKPSKNFDLRSKFYIYPGIHLFDNLIDASERRIDISAFK